MKMIFRSKLQHLIKIRLMSFEQLYVKFYVLTKLNEVILFGIIIK